MGPYIFTKSIFVAVLGDMTVFLLFVFLGKAEHEISVAQALFRTALPFGLAWLIISATTMQTE